MTVSPTANPAGLQDGLQHGTAKLQLAYSCSGDYHPQGAQL